MTKQTKTLEMHANADVVAPTRFPLTPTQTGLIYESVLSDQPWVNLEQIVCRLNDEPVDPVAMAQVWQQMIARHAVLRSVCEWQGVAVPQMRIMPTTPVVFEHMDLQDLSSQAQEDHLAGWLKADRDSGVDLTQTGNWRLTWFQLGPRQSVLVWTFHHAMLDGRSFTMLLQEALEAYTAQVSGVSDAIVPGDLVPFSNHCIAVASMDHSDARQHFAEKLDGFDQTNKVDLGDRLTGQENSRKAVIERRMPPEFASALGVKANASGVTVATLIMVAWGIVVARCSNRSDAVFGVTRSGRHLVENAAKMAGCLITTVPQRVTLQEDMEIDALLRSVRQDQVRLRPFEQTPLTEIAGVSELPAGEGLFHSAVVFEHGSLGELLRGKGGVWASRDIEVLEEGALPLTLAVYNDAQMLLRLEFARDQHSSDTAKRLLDFTIELLVSIAHCPGETKLSRLNMLPAAEQADLMELAQDQDKLTAQNRVMSVVGAFENRVRLHGKATAIIDETSGETVTFEQLENRTAEISVRLQKLGIGQGDLVAIVLPRSIDFVAGMLATLRLGGSFLPVDPSYPSDAISHMLGDSRAAAMITDRASKPAAQGISALVLDGPDTRAAVLERAEHLPSGYVIYTSGTTGKPKGVIIPETALCAHIASITDAFELTDQDRILQFASLSFDVSIEEVLPCLLAGARLVLRSAEMAESMSAFLERCQQLALSVLNLPTAFWHALVDHLDITGQRLPETVRLVIAGGEAISPAALEKWRKMQPGLRWLNGYGPTEATITATLFEPATGDACSACEDVSIGRPLPHTRAYVMAADGSLAPRGAMGELRLGGDAIAQGYLYRPELTVDKFKVDHLVWPVAPEARAYSTGDMVRWLPDGQLAFAGRSDRQIKLNGFRIELREVERALESLPSVALAICAVDGKGSSNARLLAWVTSVDVTTSLDADALQEQVGDLLPKHMVPTVVVVQDFPKTPGGKVDLNALPRPKHAVTAATKSEPINHRTLRVSQIMAEVLGQSAVDPDASFYDLGGHSLVAIRLISRIEMEFGKRLSIAALHAGPTSRQIADGLLGGAPVAQSDLVIPIQPKGNKPPIYGVHVLGAKEAFYRPLAEKLGTDQPLLGLSVGPLVEGVPTAVKETAAAYREALQSYQPTGPINLMAVSQGSYIALELAQQLRAVGRDVAMLSLFDAAGPGGRARLNGMPRFRAHLGLLRANGISYLRQIAMNRLENLRNGFEKRKFQRLKRNGKAGQAATSVEAFVAANTLAIEEYEAKPYQGSITVFRARESVFDAPEAIRAALGWRQVAKGTLQLIEVPGGHLSLLQEPNVETLAAHLVRIVDQCECGATDKNGGRKPIGLE